MGFLSALTNLLVQCFRDFDSKDLGLRDLGMRLRRTQETDTLIQPPGNDNDTTTTTTNDNNNNNHNHIIITILLTIMII